MRFAVHNIRRFPTHSRCTRAKGYQRRSPNVISRIHDGSFTSGLAASRVDASSHGIRCCTRCPVQRLSACASCAALLHAVQFGMTGALEHLHARPRRTVVIGDACTTVAAREPAAHRALMGLILKGARSRAAAVRLRGESTWAPRVGAPEPRLDVCSVEVLVPACLCASARGSSTSLLTARRAVILAFRCKGPEGHVSIVV